MTQNFNLSARELASLFGFAYQRKNSVLWLRDQNNKQLYVSPQYEQIWERNSRPLFEEPISWYDALLPTEHNDIAQKMQIRRSIQTPAAVKEILFRIHVPGGKIKYIRDACVKLFDQQGKLKAYAGISESLPHDEWRYYYEDSQTPNASSKNTLTEFQHILSSITDGSLQTTTPSSEKKNTYTILTARGKIQLSKREAQCLYHLCHGKSAKQTGGLLFISQRTVETYLDMLRKKTFSRTKLEMLGKINVELFLAQFT